MRIKHLGITLGILVFGFFAKLAIKAPTTGLKSLAETLAQNIEIANPKSLEQTEKPPTNLARRPASQSSEPVSSSNPMPTSVPTETTVHGPLDPAIEQTQKEMYRTLLEGIDAEFQLAEGSLSQTGENQQGFYQVDYTSNDGGTVTRWFGKDEAVAADQVIYDQGKTRLVRWYDSETHRLEKIMYQRDDLSGLIEFDSSSRPRSFEVWDKDHHWAFDESGLASSAFN